MMTNNSRNTSDLIVQRLDAIHSVLQDLVIFEGARSGMSKAEVRELLGVADSRVNRTWKHAKALKPVSSS